MLIVPEQIPFAQGTNAASTSRDKKQIVYRNSQYRFCFYLPADWKGYSIVQSTWREAEQGPHFGEKGPELRIQNPGWMRETHSADISILILTPRQWRLAKDGEILHGAAPVGPSRLGSNSSYVFALPARFSLEIDGDAGWQEVEEILAENPLRSPC